MDITNKKEDVPEKNEGFLQFVIGGKKNHDDMLNMFQYMIYAIIPVVLLIKLTDLIIPKYDSSNSYIENLAESLGQYGMLLLGIWIIDRAIRYFPTWSKVEYHDFNYTFISAFILGAHQKGLPAGMRLNDAVDSILSIIGFKTESKKEAPKVAQPINPAQLGPPPPVSTQHSTSQVAVPPLLPSDKDLTKLPSQGSPDFNAMYQHNNTPLQDAATPGMQEPLAANELGGFSSW